MALDSTDIFTIPQIEVLVVEVLETLGFSVPDSLTPFTAYEVDSFALLELLVCIEKKVGKKIPLRSIQAGIPLSVRVLAEQLQGILAVAQER